MTAVIAQFPTHKQLFPRGGWTQKERSFIEILMSMHSLRGLYDRYSEGMSDEDDPWASLTGPNGNNILFHLARYGGQYHIFGAFIEGRSTKHLSDLAEWYVEMKVRTA